MIIVNDNIIMCLLFFGLLSIGAAYQAGFLNRETALGFSDTFGDANFI